MSDLSLTFGDILLAPQYSDLRSRKEASLETKIGPHTFSLPLISSPMDTVTGGWMAAEMACAGGLGIVHRGQTILSQYDELVFAKNYARHHLTLPVFDVILGAAIGVKEVDIERAQACVEAGAKIICIDVSHGHHILVKEQVERLNQFLPDVTIIAGNVATDMGAHFLESLGVHAIRVGIGNGSICSTRLNTGHGVPQVEALQAAKLYAPHTAIISDGGCSTAGDILKALALGADMVMLGSMLAGTNETPGDFVAKNDSSMKSYRGMASAAAQSDWTESVYSVEGIASVIPAKGSVGKILEDIRQNLQAGLSYSGARTIKELQEKAQFLQVTQAGQREGRTHILEYGVEV